MGMLGGFGAMGTPDRTSLVPPPGIARLPPSAEMATGRGDNLRDPPGPRTDPGRQSSPSRPSPSPWLPSPTQPLELPGRFFLPLYKEKGQRAHVSFSRSLGLELFHQSQRSWREPGRLRGEGKETSLALPAWEGRVLPQHPAHTGTQNPHQSLSIPAQIGGGPEMGVQCCIPIALPGLLPKSTTRVAPAAHHPPAAGEMWPTSRRRCPRSLVNALFSPAAFFPLLPRSEAIWQWKRRHRCVP